MTIFSQQDLGRDFTASAVTAMTGGKLNAHTGRVRPSVGAFETPSGFSDSRQNGEALAGFAALPSFRWKALDEKGAEVASFVIYGVQAIGAQSQESVMKSFAADDTVVPPRLYPTLQSCKDQSHVLNTTTWMRYLQMAQMGALDNAVAWKKESASSAQQTPGRSNAQVVARPQ